jgi:hypothetical protein
MGRKQVLDEYMVDTGSAHILPMEREVIELGKEKRR